MREIVTESGTVYTIENGRITRQGGPCEDGTNPTVVNEPFRLRYKGHPTNPPTIGERFGFTVKSTGEGFHTTRVTAILDYCRSCDTFGDWFRCQRGERVAAAAGVSLDEARDLGMDDDLAAEWAAGNLRVVEPSPELKARFAAAIEDSL